MRGRELNQGREKKERRVLPWRAESWAIRGSCAWKNGLGVLVNWTREARDGDLSSRSSDELKQHLFSYHVICKLRFDFGLTKVYIMLGER